MEKAVRIATIWGIAALGLALWLGLMGGWPHAAQAAPLADTVPVTTTIQAAIDAAHDGDVVSIPSGTYTESLTVDKTLTLTGVSSAMTIIQAVSGQRVITVTAGHNLRLENLTVTGGHPTSTAGGGIYLAGGSLQIVNCRIANNSADYGGGVFQAGTSGRVDVTDSRIELNTTGNHGGGLYVDGSAALTNTQVLSNTAGWHGGGLHVQDGRTDLNGGLFSNNRAMGDNGGAVNVNNSISVTGTQFISNTAVQEGGALLQWNAGYTVTVTNARFEHNAAGSDGGGLSVYGNMAVTGTLVYSNSAATWGGGLFMGPGRLTVHSSMFFGNTSYRGGGIALNGSTAQIDRSIVSGNSVTTHGGGIDVWAARLRLTNAVVADNHAYLGNGIYLYESPLDVLHTTIARNSGGQGSGIHANCDLTSCGTVALTNTILVSHTVGITVTAGNTATLNGVLWYSNTANTGGTGIVTVTNAITGAPAFAADGYHLTSISKAINAGIAAGVATDIDGEPRDAAPDLGADEFRTCWARLNYNATDYGHVQAAVDASTLPADVVKVAGYCPGVQSRTGVSQTVYISKSLTMRGGYTTTNWTTSNPVANPTILDAKQGGRVMYLTGGSSVNIALENLIVRGGSTNDIGGGIYDDNVTLTLSNAIVRDNVSTAWGGGVYVQSGHATVSGGQIFSNTAKVGGGVYVQSGSTIVVSRTQILSNTASIGGGGVYVNSSALLMVTDSTVSGNTGSWWGGGIVNQGSALTLTNSTLSGNQAISSTYGGGAIDQGGSSSATILNSTIVSNTAVNAARSGIWLESGTLTIQNSIVALNNGTNNVAISGGTFTSLGYNLTNSGAGTPFTATSDLINTNPLLGPLQNNGGSTWTHALLPGSPAIDRIPFGTNGCGTSITTDQRGQPRPTPTGGRCDIGAYELQFACRAQIGTGATFDSGDAAAVQAAVDAAPSGDTIKVAGTCAGVQLRAGISQTVYIAKPLTVRGGYTFADWTTSNPVAYPTILDAKSGGRVVVVTGGSSVNVTLENLIVRNGSSTGDIGGGILNNFSVLNVSNTVVSGNSASMGGGIRNEQGALTVVNSTFANNSSSAWGGGIANYSGTLSVSSSTFTSNTSPYGGGIADNGYLTVTGSTLVGNSAPRGGGMFVYWGLVSVNNSTFSGNRSTQSGAWDGGGAIEYYFNPTPTALAVGHIPGGDRISGSVNPETEAVPQATLAAPSAIMINCTVVSNTAAVTNTSGIWLEGGTLNIGNSIVAHNGVTNNVQIDGGTFASLGYNLTNSGAGTPFTATGDLANTNPLLGPLQDNGGSSWTHALLPGSPAINRIPNGTNGCGTTITTDQRGWPRPFPPGGKCDVGAFESVFKIYLPLVVRQ